MCTSSMQPLDENTNPILHKSLKLVFRDFSVSFCQTTKHFFNSHLVICRFLECFSALHNKLVVWYEIPNFALEKSTQLWIRTDRMLSTKSKNIVLVNALARKASGSFLFCFVFFSRLVCHLQKTNCCLECVSGQLQGMYFAKGFNWLFHKANFKALTEIWYQTGCGSN